MKCFPFDGGASGGAGGSLLTTGNLDSYYGYLLSCVLCMTPNIKIRKLTRALLFHLIDVYSLLPLSLWVLFYITVLRSCRWPRLVKQNPPSYSHLCAGSFSLSVRSFVRSLVVKMECPPCFTFASRISQFGFSSFSLLLLRRSFFPLLFLYLSYLCAHL